MYFSLAFHVIIIFVGCVLEVRDEDYWNEKWFCNLDWKTHENNYYECSKYRGQPQSQLETKQSRAREALKKYLHYFERVRIMCFSRFNWFFFGYF